MAIDPLRMPNFNFQVPTMPNLPEIKSPAEYVKDALVESIKAFQASLGPEEEMGVHVSGTLSYRVTGIGYSSSMIVFYGVDDDGRRMQTYQHHSQTNLTLMALAKPAEVEKARRVGFDTSPREAEPQSAS